MAVSSPATIERSFLIYFYCAAEAPEHTPSRAFYAIDFGVYKHEHACQLSSFDAISDVYGAILQKVSIKSENAPNDPKVSLLSHAQMHEQLAPPPIDLDAKY